MPDPHHLLKIVPRRNEARYYRCFLWPDLFGDVVVVREWGRIGQPGQVRRDRHADQTAAASALDGLVRAKRRGGYVYPGQPSRPSTERTAEGVQYVLPGAERVPARPARAGGGQQTA